MKKLKVLITGATGMVGEGVMHECLLSDQIEEVWIMNRRASGHNHPKLREIIHENFYDITAIANRHTGFDACFFCLGVTSVGKSEEEYTRQTHTLTLHVAGILAAGNPEMTFVYVSGAGTDSSEQGRLMWARVKGKTENDLMKLPFKRCFAFRPGFMRPTRGLKNTLKGYTYLGWLFPVLKWLAPNTVSTLSDVGKVMIYLAVNGYEKQVIEVSDINSIAKK